MMKKVYEAPVFEYESYELDEFVASCGNKSPNHGREACVVDFDGMGYLFTDANKACVIKESELGDETSNDGYCYHIPVPSLQYFGS